jgi:arginase family enzyme
MNKRVTVLNFDETYLSQDFLHGDIFDWIHLDGLLNANLFCEKESLRSIDEQLMKYPKNDITLIGNGNYHYVTFLLLSKITQPFSLVLLDHHTDMYPSPSDDLIACSSWVLEAMRQLSQLKKVIFVGVNEDWKMHIPARDERSAVYSKHHILVDFPSVIESIMNEIPTSRIYISIDKDVLDEEEAQTAWSHGSMKLYQITELLEELYKHKEIVGLDVCGEYPFSLHDRYKKHIRDYVKKNEQANKMVLEKVWILVDQREGKILH